MSSSDQDDRSNFDWGSPRWREPDPDSQADVEFEHRYRNTPARRQPGAIDRSGAIGGDAGTGPPAGPDRRGDEDVSAGEDVGSDHA